MDDREYSEKAARTLSGEFHSDKISVVSLTRVLKQLVAYGASLDQMKKGLFYGKDIGQAPTTGTEHVLEGFSEAEQHTAHGIIGKLTECTELAEILLKRILDGTPMDRTHLIEEVGDDQWYSNALLKGIDATMTEAKVRNIAKLTKRYPERFSLERAENRDLVAERAALEGSSVPKFPSDQAFCKAFGHIVRD